MGLVALTENLLPSTARSMMVGRVFLVLTGACQFGHGLGGFTTNFIHSALTENIFSGKPTGRSSERTTMAVVAQINDDAGRWLRSVPTSSKGSISSTGSPSMSTVGMCQPTDSASVSMKATGRRRS